MPVPFFLSLALVVGASRTPPPSSAEAASYLNGAYGHDDSGILMRGVSYNYTKPWLSRRCKDFQNESTCTDKPVMSWVVMNRFMWDEVRGRITVYVAGGGTGLVGLIATPDTPIRCAFPSDAGTVSRGMDGCGEHRILFPVNKSAWCPKEMPKPADLVKKWPGYDLSERYAHKNSTVTDPTDGLEWTGCAFQPDRLAEALEIFGAAKRAKTVTRQWSFLDDVVARDPKELPSAGAWTEVVVDGHVWNQAIEKGSHKLYAWYMLDECLAVPACVQGAQQIGREFKAIYGFTPPVVGVTLTRRDAPFHAIAAVAEPVVV